METRGDEQQVYACTAEHTLMLRDGMLKVRQKRVNLLNCDAALPSVQLFMQGYWRGARDQQIDPRFPYFMLIFEVAVVSFPNQ